MPADMTYKEWYSKYMDEKGMSVKRKAFDKTIKNGTLDLEVDNCTYVC